MRGNSSGFTLIELILVMVIIGILAGAVSLNLSGRTQDAMIARVQSDLKVYETAIDLYAMDHNDKFPKALGDLTGGKRDYVKEIKNDPWGNPYIFRVPGKNRKPYDLYSRGPDEQAETADDISVWKLEDANPRDREER